jgi:mRNA interferase MazF
MNINERQPITTHGKGYPFEVAIPAGLAAAGVFLADQVKSLDWRIRQAEFFCVLPEATIREVLLKLNTLIVVE